MKQLIHINNDRYGYFSSLFYHRSVPQIFSLPRQYAIETPVSFRHGDSILEGYIEGYTVAPFTSWQRSDFHFPACDLQWYGVRYAVRCVDGKPYQRFEIDLIEYNAPTYRISPLKWLKSENTMQLVDDIPFALPESNDVGRLVDTVHVGDLSVFERFLNHSDTYIFHEFETLWDDAQNTTKHLLKIIVANHPSNRVMHLRHDWLEPFVEAGFLYYEHAAPKAYLYRATQKLMQNKDICDMIREETE